MNLVIYSNLGLGDLENLAQKYFDEIKQGECLDDKSSAAEAFDSFINPLDE